MIPQNIKHVMKEIILTIFIFGGCVAIGYFFGYYIGYSKANLSQENIISYREDFLTKKKEYDLLMNKYHDEMRKNIRLNKEIKNLREYKSKIKEYLNNFEEILFLTENDEEKLKSLFSFFDAILYLTFDRIYD